jgi:hypothetical protein
LPVAGRYGAGTAVALGVAVSGIGTVGRIGATGTVGEYAGCVGVVNTGDVGLGTGAGGFGWHEVITVSATAKKTSGKITASAHMMVLPPLPGCCGRRLCGGCRLLMPVLPPDAAATA